jgi:drug/metabolite transporter (DMT)-like permease
MTETDRPVWMTLAAFAIIYFVWGSTFLAIRIGVHEVPPLIFAGLRFLPAGVVLTAWMMLRGERLPTGREWLSGCVLAVLMFVVDYGLLFWAEQRVPSGVAAVMMAMIPVFIALAEIVLLRTRRMTGRLAVALAIGIVGVGVLVGHASALGSAAFLGAAALDRRGAAALLVGAVSWSVASVLSRRLPLPESKGMSSGTQMLVGGAMLLATAAGFGEFGRFHPAAVSRGAWVALAYLVVAGSIVGFTAYVWLLAHESPTKVGTYAYVNPVVAVVMGYFLGGETLGVRTVVGTVCVLVSVGVITTMPVARRPG